jgi:hypothetical protein
MRLVIFVAVVAAHVIVLFLWPAWRGAWVAEHEEPTPQRTPEPVWQALLLYQSNGKQGAPVSPPLKKTAPAKSAKPASEQSPAEHPVATSPATVATPTPMPPDWRALAQEVADQDAKQIVAAEDAAASRANALTARFKPMPPPRVRGPEFGWDYAATHRITPLPQGGFVYSINDYCQILVLPLPFIGCALGKSHANGDLFKNRHPPMKYGDWDWRVQDP